MVPNLLERFRGLKDAVEPVHVPYNVVTEMLAGTNALPYGYIGINTSILRGLVTTETGMQMLKDASFAASVLSESDVNRVQLAMSGRHGQDTDWSQKVEKIPGMWTINKAHVISTLGYFITEQPPQISYFGEALKRPRVKKVSKYLSDPRNEDDIRLLVDTVTTAYDLIKHDETIGKISRLLRIGLARDVNLWDKNARPPEMEKLVNDLHILDYEIPTRDTLADTCDRRVKNIIQFSPQMKQILSYGSINWLFYVSNTNSGFASH